MIGYQNKNHSIFLRTLPRSQTIGKDEAINMYELRKNGWSTFHQQSDHRKHDLIKSNLLFKKNVCLTGSVHTTSWLASINSRREQDADRKYEFYYRFINI